MPVIAPFKGLRYEPSRVGSLAKVVTPPYDIISPEGQRKYYRQHPYNFVRVVFGKGRPRDTPLDNRYIRAQRTLARWMKEGTLRQDDTPSVYPYLQEYSLGGKVHRRWGIIALVRLDSPRVYPHEATRPQPKLDRIRLLSAVQASLSPIFGLIPDPLGDYEERIRQACQRCRPIVSLRIDGVSHRLWRLDDPPWIARLAAFLRPKEMIIADGHHRFEAALAYFRRRSRRDPSGRAPRPYQFAMFYLACAGSVEPGLLPTHRLVPRLPRRKVTRLLAAIKGHGQLEGGLSLRQLTSRLSLFAHRGQVAVGLYGAGHRGGFLLTPNSSSAAPSLDVQWVHGQIFPRWLGRTRELSYTQDLRGAAAWIRKRAQGALFVMQPPDLTRVLAWARAGRRMPGKTTYFYPKPLAGLVEYKF